MLFSGVEKGIIIIIFGLFVAFLWEKVTKNFFLKLGYQRTTLPFFPFMAFSLLIIGIING